MAKKKVDRDATQTIINPKLQSGMFRFLVLSKLENALASSSSLKVREKRGNKR